jgi:hypothetical protein
MNIDVSWDNQTRAVNGTDGSTTVRLQIDNCTAYRNNIPMALDVAPQIVEGRTLIPLRFFSEAFNCQVGWDSAIYQVSIISPPKAMTVIGFYALGDSQTSSWTNLFGQIYPNTAAGNTDVISELILGISAPSETAASIATKVGIAKRYNLNGIALWRLGLINDGMWQTLRDSLTASR